jgi:hypothetical protein
VTALNAQKEALNATLLHDLRGGRRDVACKTLHEAMRVHHGATAFQGFTGRLAAQRSFLADTIADALAKNASHEVGELLHDALRHIQQVEAFHTSSLQEQRSQLSQSREGLLSQRAVHEDALAQHVRQGACAAAQHGEDQKGALTQQHAHLVATSAQLESGTLDQAHTHRVRDAHAVLRKATATTGAELTSQQERLKQTMEQHATGSWAQKDKQCNLLAGNRQCVEASVEDQLRRLQAHHGALEQTLQEQREEVCVCVCVCIYICLCLSLFLVVSPV